MYFDENFAIISTEICKKRSKIQKFHKQAGSKKNLDILFRYSFTSRVVRQARVYIFVCTQWPKDQHYHNNGSGMHTEG